MQNKLVDFRQDMQLEIGLTCVQLQAVQTAIIYGNFNGVRKWAGHSGPDTALVLLACWYCAEV